MSNILLIIKVVLLGWAFNLLIGGPLTNYLKREFLVEKFGYSLFTANLILYSSAILILIVLFAPVRNIFARFFSKG